MKIIPNGNNPWPNEAWGIQLGSTVSSIRRGLNYVSKREDFISIGFAYESQIRERYDLIRLSLSKYQEIYGDMLVPQKFVIPNENDSWPKEAWGMKLGTIVNSIRSGLNYDSKKDDLVSIGFSYGKKKSA
jgi:hypothetical protein